MKKRYWYVLAAVIVLLAITSLSLSIAAIVLLNRSSNTSDTEETKPANETTSGISPSTPSSNQSKPTNATTVSAWESASDYLKQSLNSSIRPCQDSFHFACGGWIRKYASDRDQPISVTERARAKVSSIIENGLDTLNPDKYSIPMFYRKIAAAYQQCIRGSDPKNSALWELIDALDSWPMLNANWNISCGSAPLCEQFDIGQSVANLQSRHGVSSLFSTTVEPDWKSPTKYVVHLHQGTLFLGSGLNYVSTDFVGKRSEYIKQIVNIAVILAQEANISLKLQDVFFSAAETVNFETEIAKILISPENNRNPVRKYNPMSKSQLKFTWPNINWEFYFSILIPKHQLKTVQNLTVWIPAFQKYRNYSEYSIWPDANTVIVHEPEYFIALNDLLNITKTSPENLQNYFIWRFLGERLFMINKQALNSTLKSLWNLKSNGNRILPSKTFCTGQIQNAFPFVSGRIYLDINPYDIAITQEINAMIQNIFKSFTVSIDSLAWMDTQIKNLSKEKLNAIVINIGYSSLIMNDTALGQFTHPLNFTLLRYANPLAAFESIAQFNHEASFDKLGTKVDRNFFGLNHGPAEVNLWYDPVLNSLTIPVAIMQIPFFGINYPKVYNYGFLGSIIGQGIGHAFNDIGIHFWKDGLLTNWFDPSAMTGFNSILQCFEKEYSKFCPSSENESPICVNGNATAGENMADTIGAQAAYDAYQTYVSKNGHEADLPGLPYDTNQVLFMSMLQQWCSYVPANAVATSMLVDPHIPGRVRGLGTIMNTPAYGQNFKCTQGTDFMYPLPKDMCTVF